MQLFRDKRASVAGRQRHRVLPPSLRQLRSALAALAILACVAGCATSADNSASTSAGKPHHSTDPLSSLRLYVSPQNPAALQVAAWRAVGNRTDAAALEQIAREPTATWLTGDQPPKSSAEALVSQSSAAGDAAIITLYDIPNRDCQGYSAGGAANGSQYLAWVAQVAQGLGQHTAIIILEPDAIDQAASGCLSPSAAATRYRQLAGAVTLLKQDRHAHVYIDAGNAAWLSAGRIVQPLLESGVSRANGFSLNVANFQTTQASIAYGRELSDLLGGRHFVIDTSRNGNGPPSNQPGLNHWCNPPGRALGTPPSTNTGHALVDAFLWIKYPGESDGQCQTGQPPAGAWWPAYGLALAKKSQLLASRIASHASAASGALSGSS